MNSPPGLSKYFIALIPPPSVYDLAMQWKEFFKTNFNSKAALNSPPHITLHMPFERKTSKEEMLKTAFQKFSSEQQPFHVQVKNFGCFPPRVIFLQVVENASLHAMQKRLVSFCKLELNLFNANRLDKPFNPHLTVAFRDLKKNDFPKAWELIQTHSFEENFFASQLSLLKRTGHFWTVLENFDFQEPYQPEGN